MCCAALEDGKIILGVAGNGNVKVREGVVRVALG